LNECLEFRQGAESVARPEHIVRPRRIGDDHFPRADIALDC
jgi:hypothetical protein